MKGFRSITLCGCVVLSMVAVGKAEVIWQENFEDVPCGELPEGWGSGCGCPYFGVDCDRSCEGERSLRLHGMLGGCCASLVSKLIHPDGVYLPEFTLEFMVDNATQDLSGCHPYRASLSMYATQCWGPGRSRDLLTVKEDGCLAGTTWEIIGCMTLDECHRIRIQYTRLDAATVRVRYWLDGEFLTEITTGAMESEVAVENDLVWFQWGAQEGTAWFDDVVMHDIYGDAVSLDIKPGSCPNPLNRRSYGVLPVSLVAGSSFDASGIDLATIQLSRADGIGGSVIPLEGPPGPHSVIADVATPFDGEPCDCHELEGDGILDLSMKFATQEVVEGLLLNELPSGAVVELVVTGMLLDGTPFEASDCVTIVPRESIMTIGPMSEPLSP
ncbi:MAG: hypothetical protein JSV78_02240 [Phycisphaerales bacterium]|nr:MAG: hypothetical protein JSV78_02240 [Phycisphaerales bacterium]